LKFIVDTNSWWSSVCHKYIPAKLGYFLFFEHTLFSPLFYCLHISLILACPLHLSRSITNICSVSKYLLRLFYVQCTVVRVGDTVVGKNWHGSCSLCFYCHKVFPNLSSVGHDFFHLGTFLNCLYPYCNLNLQYLSAYVVSQWFFFLFYPFEVSIIIGIFPIKVVP